MGRKWMSGCPGRGRVSGVGGVCRGGVVGGLVGGEAWERGSEGVGVDDGTRLGAAQRPWPGLQSQQGQGRIWPERNAVHPGQTYPLLPPAWAPRHSFLWWGRSGFHRAQAETPPALPRGGGGAGTRI